MSYVVWARFSHHRLLRRMGVACHCGLMGDMGDVAAVCDVVASWMDGGDVAVCIWESCSYCLNHKCSPIEIIR